jgi:RNA polymerase sigma-70 factor, ECF subfamily
VASVLRMTGDLAVAEDAVQEACLAALAQWPGRGWPDQPRAWLIGVARHKAVDLIRREAVRSRKEAAAVRDLAAGGPPEPEPGLWPWPPAPPSTPSRSSATSAPAHPAGPSRAEGASLGGAAGAAAGIAGLGDDELGLIFMCCHPALALEARVALTLRCVCGLSTAQIAAGFLVPEATMARRLSRAKAKIADSGIRLRQPAPGELPSRLAAVLRVTYLVFTEGHKASRGPDLVRGELCDAALRLARGLAALLPGEPEVTGLLALLLLTDARRAARTGPGGELVLLEDQDRSRWDQAMISEGERLLVGALRAGRPGPYQLHAAIAACHSTSPDAAGTDWREIAALYGELIRYEPSPVVEANRAIAVAMSEGPAAGLVILDAVGHHPQLSRWPQLHLARADLLARLGRAADAVAAYRAALELEPTAPERAFIARRIGELRAGQ